MTLQEQFNAIKNGKGNKVQFLKQARSLFPQYLNQYSDFNTSVNVLKSKQIINEAVGGVVTKGFNITNWKQIFEAEVKAEEKTTSKEAADANKSAYQPSNVKNADNINFNEILKGYLAELGDVKNAGKTGDELKEIAVKNLAKDPLFYTKNGEFGIKGVGYTTEAPGLGEPKEAKGKHKSSGYGDIDKEIKVKANVKDSLGSQEAKDSMPKKVKEMTTTPQSSAGVKKMKMPGAEKKIKLQENKDESESKLRFVIAKLIKEELKRSNISGSEYIEINGKVVRTYVQNGDKSYSVEYDDGTKDIIAVSNDAWSEINDLHMNATNLNEPIEEKSMDLRSDEEKKLSKLFDKKPEDLKKKYQDQQKNPNSSIFPKKESINSNLNELKLRSVIAKLIKEELDKDESDLDDRLKKYVENEVPTGDWKSIKNYYKEMTQDKPDPKRRYFELVDGILKKHGY
jgi:hypothetical protein